MTTLIAHAGLTGPDIEALVVAGGFGSHIRLASAERIGLIPPGFAAKARTIGNGAGMGAAMILLSERVRMDSERIRDLAEVVELSTNPKFMEDYVEGMFFPAV
ncbi:MAG TPA: ASKHA domain-containing protein, partial [Clostridia bacterium]|nr:ASKHA domain-containing protein [Clostridia bacterium]